MSRIYFHSEHGESEVRGSERAYAGWLCTQLLYVSLELTHSYHDKERTRKYLRLFPSDHYVHSRTDIDTVRLALGIPGDSIIIGNETVSTFQLALNTAFKMGSAPVQILARLHGQCEIHCYVEGKNRKWLSDIIERGIRIGVMRGESGWEETIELLRSHDNGAVVTSYSVKVQFPNREAAGVHMGDEWYDLPHERRWQMAMDGLRSGSMGDGLEMSPDSWDSFYFGDGKTGFDALEYVNEQEVPNQFGWK